MQEKEVKFGDSKPGQVVEDLRSSYSGRYRGEFHYRAALNISKGSLGE